MEPWVIMSAPDAAMFGFAEIVQKEFGFLLEHGFACVSASPTKVRYESKMVYIEISYSDSDGEVAISFGRLKEKEEFSFTLFLRLVDSALERALGERLAYNADQVRRCVVGLANALKSRGWPIISGQDWIFERMKNVRWWDFQPDALEDT
jgi:hypothetical protein